MPWQVAALLKIAGGSVLAPLVFRLLGDAGPRERAVRIAQQYAWALAFSLPLALALSGTAIPSSSEAWKIAVVGALMPFGVLFQWRAYAWSLSRSAIFIPLSGVVPLIMSATLLGEWRVLESNALLAFGFVLVLLGMGAHAIYDASQKRRSETPAALPRAFYGNAIAFTVIFGVGTFLLNHWAKAGVSTADLITAWYGGAFLGSLVLLAVTSGLKRTPSPQSLARHGLVAVAAACILVNIAMEFVALQRAPQTVVLPIFAVADVVGPFLVGGLAFREWSTVRGLEWLFLGVALAGTLVMAVAHV